MWPPGYRMGQLLLPSTSDYTSDALSRNTSLQIASFRRPKPHEMAVFTGLAPGVHCAPRYPRRDQDSEPPRPAPRLAAPRARQPQSPRDRTPAIPPPSGCRGVVLFCRSAVVTGRSAQPTRGTTSPGDLIAAVGTGDAGGGMAAPLFPPLP